MVVLITLMVVWPAKLGKTVTDPRVPAMSEFRLNEQLQGHRERILYLREKLYNTSESRWKARLAVEEERMADTLEKLSLINNKTSSRHPE